MEDIFKRANFDREKEYLILYIHLPGGSTLYHAFDHYEIYDNALFLPESYPMDSTLIDPALVEYGARRIVIANFGQCVYTLSVREKTEKWFN